MENYFIYILVFFFSYLLSKVIRKYIRGGIYFRLLRISMINLPYLCIFIFFDLPIFNLELNIYYLLITIVSALLLIALNWESIYYLFSLLVISISPRIYFKNLISRFGEVTLLPIIEELFYRGIIPIKSSITEILFFSILSTSLFVFVHYLSYKNEGVWYFSLLFILSLVSIVIYFYTENILYSIILHFLYNLPWFVGNCRKYYMQRRHAFGKDENKKFM